MEHCSAAVNNSVPRSQKSTLGGLSPVTVSSRNFDTVDKELGPLTAFVDSAGHGGGHVQAEDFDLDVLAAAEAAGVESVVHTSTYMHSQQP